MTVRAEFEAKLADAENVEQDKTTLSLIVGETATLTAAVTPSHAETVSWRVHPLAHIVEINASGDTVTVAAKSAGTAVITAAIDGNTASCAVTVTGGGEPDTIPHVWGTTPKSREAYSFPQRRNM